MEKYEQLSVVGEGSYGLVMKCRHRETDQIVAVKKFLETEEDATIRKMALREIRMLKRLKHENLVTMIEVFRHRKRFYLVFEYLEGTVLDELDKMPGGLGDERSRERIFQVTRAVSYCHSNQIIHRDVKPENVLVSSLGVVKLCDFGFARIVSSCGDACTEYVATRWYRAPELLVGDPYYGTAIDIWAIGCLFAEMMTGDPLFPGDSDIDQLYLIVTLLGEPCLRHQQLMPKNSQSKNILKIPSENRTGLHKKFITWHLQSINFLNSCMKMDPQQRLTADELLKHNYFTHDRFPQRFLPALREKVNKEFNNPLLRKFKTEILISTDKTDDSKKRFSQSDSKWRFSLTEGTVKRKLSGDTLNSESINDKNFITLSKTAQRLNILHAQNQLPTQTVKEKSGKNLSIPKLLQSSNDSGQIQMLEKSLDSLGKFQNRPISAQKEETPNHPLSNSPLPFQSLHFVEDYNKSPQNQIILHPSVNNISFNKDPPKKSPNVLHNLNTNPKTLQVPLLCNARTQFTKKFERNIFTENSFAHGDQGPQTWNDTSIWLNSITTNMFRRKENKSRNDFSLPNLPGVASISNKLKKEAVPESEHHSPEVTPEYRYMRAKRKRNTLDISLPCPVKQNG